MIIVSQDRNVILNFNNVNCIGRKDIHIYVDLPNDSFPLGAYETEERAKEVLQSIIMAINSSSKMFKMPEE